MMKKIKVCFKPIYMAVIFMTCGWLSSANAALINVSIAMDSSGSVGRDNWNLQENFVIALINDFAALRTDELDIRFAIFQFAGYADRRHSFGQEQQDLSKITSKVSNLRYTGGSTHTRSLINNVIYEHTLFDEKVDLHLSYLITDGNPYPSRTQNPCSLRPSLDAANVEMTVVGVGYGYDADRIECLVKGRERMIKVSDFNDLGDPALRTQITQLASLQSAQPVSEPRTAFMLMFVLAAFAFSAFNRRTGKTTQQNQTSLSTIQVS